MTPEDLKVFKQEIADPRMRELFTKTELPDGICFIDSLSIEFLDGRSLGVDSVITASGLVFVNNKVQEYHYEMPDVSVSDFIAEHKGCSFISDGTLRVFDELDGFEVNTYMWNHGRCAKVFDELACLQELELCSQPLEYLKMKFIFSERKTSLSEKMEQAAKQAGESASSRNQVTELSRF